MRDYAHDRSRFVLAKSELSLLLLFGDLLGCALMGKSFAHLGIPPSYEGETAAQVDNGVD
jgi:hypothetical protein